MGYSNKSIIETNVIETLANNRVTLLLHFDSNCILRKFEYILSTMENWQNYYKYYIKRRFTSNWYSFYQKVFKLLYQNKILSFENKNADGKLGWT